jgi:hypothetical protein
MNAASMSEISNKPPAGTCHDIVRASPRLGLDPELAKAQVDRCRAAVSAATWQSNPTCRPELVRVSALCI